MVEGNRGFILASARYDAPSLCVEVAATARDATTTATAMPIRGEVCTDIRFVDTEWTLHLVRDESKPAQKAFWWEMRHKTDGTKHRCKHSVDSDQPTANPGGASGDPAHEQWLQDNICYRPNDIVISTFPKCGTTLTENIVLLLLNGGSLERLDPLSKNSVQHGVDPMGRGKIWPEGCLVPKFGDKPPNRPPAEEFVPVTLEQFEQLPEPRVIKTHAPVPKLLRGGLPCDGPPRPAKYIVCTRNPLDACVSCYYHAWNPHKSGWPFEAWALAWLAGAEMFGSYFTWHREWYLLYSNPPPGVEILWVYYEALLESPNAEVQRIADFLGVDYRTDPSLIERVVNGSSFDSMKSAADKAKESADAAGDTRPSASSDHLRKGIAGDWRNHFTPMLSAKFKVAFAAEMEECEGLNYSLGTADDGVRETMSVASCLALIKFADAELPEDDPDWKPPDEQTTSDGVLV